MRVTKRNESLPLNITVEGVSMKQVTNFRYLGSLVTEDGKCDAVTKSEDRDGESQFWQNERSANESVPEYPTKREDGKMLHMVRNVI